MWSTSVMRWRVREAAGRRCVLPPNDPDNACSARPWATAAQLSSAAVCPLS